MMRQMYRSLPGPAPLRMLTAVVILAALLVALHFFYEWLGNLLVDTGGTVG